MIQKVKEDFKNGILNKVKFIDEMSKQQQSLFEYVTLLQSYVFDRNISVDIIKCDVEGAELLVYQGGIKTIETFKPVVFTEMLRKWSAKFGYHPNDIIALFSQQGYLCYCNDGAQQLSCIREITEDTANTNFFFLHPEKHASIIERYETR